MPSQTTIPREHFTAIMKRADLWDCEAGLDGALRLSRMDTEQLLRFMVAATAVIGEETATAISGTVRHYSAPPQVVFDGVRVKAPLTGPGSVTTELGKYVATNLRGDVLRTDCQETAYEYAWTPNPLVIDMEPNPDPHYGDVAKSVAQFRIAGKGVYNRHHPHELVRWDFTGTGWEGHEEDGLRFTALPIAISAHPQTPVVTHEVRIGDVVTVDGHNYVITARSLQDPALVPVEQAAADAEKARAAKEAKVVERVFALAAEQKIANTNCGGHVNVDADGYEFTVIIPGGHRAHIAYRTGWGGWETYTVNATPEQDRKLREAFRSQHGKGPQ